MEDFLGNMFYSLKKIFSGVCIGFEIRRRCGSSQGIHHAQVRTSSGIELRNDERADHLRRVPPVAVQPACQSPFQGV